MSNSWYVEFLLRNRLNIRSNAEMRVIDDYTEPICTSVESIDNLTAAREPGYTMDLDDDVYNDLLIVEKVLKDNYKNGQLIEKEKIIVDWILKGKNIADIESESGISRITVSKIFSNLCDRIGFILGGEFTNDGFIDLMKEKYGLTNDQLETLIEFLNSNKRHTTTTGGKEIVTEDS